MIATSPSVCYINEPFNINKRKFIFRPHFDYWFTYVTDNNEQQYYRQIKNLVEFRNKWLCRWSHKRPLFKDPIALFSAEWLSSRFNMDTVVLIRHPAAFAGSLKVKNWTHPFEHFLSQPLLMNDHLKPFKEDIEEYAKNNKDIIDQAALLWNITHYMILKYKKNNPNWIFIRHEDLSRNPVDGFRSLFRKLNLNFLDSTIKSIEMSSSTEGPTNGRSRDKFRDLNRDSLANIYTWRYRLSSSEIERLKSTVQYISQEFYSEDEW